MSADLSDVSVGVDALGELLQYNTHIQEIVVDFSSGGWDAGTANPNRTLPPFPHVEPISLCACRSNDSVSPVTREESESISQQPLPPLDSIG